MGIGYPLDRIIRRVHENEVYTLDREQKLFFIDAKAKNFFDKKPRFAFGKDIRAFIVSTTNAVRCEGPRNCTINDFATDRSITLKIEYEASCEPDCEKKLILSILDGEHPGAILNKQIEKCITRFTNEKKKSDIDIIQKFYELKPELIKTIANYIYSDMGLYLDVKITLEYENEIKRYTIKTGFFPVYVKDYKDELNLKFKADIDVFKSNKIAAILNYPNMSNFENLIKDITTKLVLDSFTLHQFCYELDEVVHEIISENINKQLHKCGYILSALSLESSKIKDLPQETDLIKHNVKCEIKGFHGEIVVEHKLLLNLKDVGCLKSSNVNNLEEWARNELDNATKSVFFDKTYAELILDFDPYDIEKIVKQKAEQIGYNVKQLIVIPNLEPLKLKDGFLIDYKGKFATHDSRVEVKLNIVVSGRVPEQNLKSIKHLLTPNTNIQEEMEGAVIKETQHFLHNVNPERFYMRFSYSDIENEPPVDQELAKAITKILKNRFCAEGIHVTLKIMETELTERFQNLQQNSPYFFDMSVFPLREGGRKEKVTFRVGYEVAAIDKDRWYVFQSKKFQSSEEEIKKIQEVLKESLKSNLDIVPAEYLQYTKIKQKYAIEENLLQPSIDKIKQLFGLIVDIDLRRSETAAEVAEQNKILGHIDSQSEIDVEATKISNQAHLDELKVLYSRREEIIQAGNIDDEDEEMKIINNRIQSINQKISSYSVENEKEDFKQLTTRPDEDDFSFNDFRLTNSSEKETTKKLENKKKVVIEDES